MGATHIWIDPGPLLADHGVIVTGQEFDGALVGDIARLVACGKARPIMLDQGPVPESAIDPAIEHSETILPAEPEPTLAPVPAVEDKPRKKAKR